MLKYCKDHGVPDHLDVLLHSNFAQPNKGFKLRASAAQCRFLVPFGLHLAEEVLSAEDPVESTIRNCARHLNNVYTTLSKRSIFFNDVAREESTKFALRYVALHDILNSKDNRAWRIKPKLHMFLHICSDGGKPSLCWNYRDEDWGGSVSRLCRRKGGVLSAQAMSSGCLIRFVADTPVYRIV